jgi:hypothetical protein
MIQQSERYFKCPECGAVAVVDEDIEPGEFETCLECDEEIDPRTNPAIREEFWAYCQKLKHG